MLLHVVSFSITVSSSQVDSENKDVPPRKANGRAIEVEEDIGWLGATRESWCW
jgi:hypothetical protein